MTELFIDLPAKKRKPSSTIVLAHGAGAPMDSPFMDAFSIGLTQLDQRVVRFEFPYMAERRATEKRRPPNRAPILIETWLEVIESLKAKPAGTTKLIIGGKSMGGRIASMVADEAKVDGLVCLGYPFHPPGKPEKLRTEHLHKLKTRSLFLQGTRDPFGRQDEVDSYQLSSKIRMHWLEDGEHSFKPRKKSGRTEQQNWDEAVQAIDHFARKL